MESQHYVSLAIPAFPHSKYKELRSEGLCEIVLDKPRQSHNLPDYCIYFLTESNARSSQTLSWQAEQRLYPHEFVPLDLPFFVLINMLF